MSPAPIHVGDLDRRSFLRALGFTGAAAATGGLLAACGADETPAVGAGATSSPSPGSDPGDPRARIGYLPITDATPLLLAHSEGFYADQDLEVDRPTLLRSWPQVAEAFQSEQVDVVHLLMPMTVLMRFGQDLGLKVVAWNHTGGSGLTVANDVEHIGELAGSTVAVPFWFSIHNVAIQLLLEADGLTPILSGEPSAAEGTVKLVVMAPPDMPPALDNGTIKGFIVADPFNAVAEVQGIGKIARFTGDVWLDHACCVAVMHEQAIAERPQWAQRVVSALVHAQRFARENPADSARILSEEGGRYLPQPLPAIERSLSHYDDPEYTDSGAIRNPDWQTSRIDFQPFPFPSYTAELVTRLQSTEVDGDRAFLDDLDPDAAHDELVDDSLVRVAIDEVGGPGVFDLPEDLTRTETIDV